MAMDPATVLGMTHYERFVNEFESESYLLNRED